MLLFQLGCLRKYAEICFGKLSKASHTDALKTHSLQTFLPQDWEVKGGQQFFGTSISRKKIDTGEVSALRGGFPGPEGPFSVLQ